MKIVLSTLNAKYIHTNIAIRYLKVAAEPDFNIELSEYTIKDPAINIVADLHSKNPDIIGFSCYIWNIEETMAVIKMLKKVNPNLTIILGGPEVSYDTVEWMNKHSEVDFIVTGEGELTFKALLHAIEKNESYDALGGIAYRKDGQVSINPPREKADLNALPSPFRFKEDVPHLSKRITYIETSRGCPFSCQFCLSSIEVGVRYFNRERIKEDILYLMENGAKTIKFVDRTFNISRSYAMEMFQFLIDHHKPGTVFQFEITGDIMRPEVIEFLNENAPEGLFRFEIGVQSTNDLTNELVQRKQNFKKLARTVTMVKEGNKIAQHLDLIAGLPEENYNSFRQTFNDVFAFGAEELQLGFLKMLRGTGLRLQAEKYGYVFMDQSPYEILGNNVLDFNEIIRIKQVEDVLEKYWNDHRMDETIHYLIDNSFTSAFDFFQEFGSFWDTKGWSRIGHQLEDLFKRLLLFLQAKDIKGLDIVEGLMKVDYLTRQRYKPRKVWWDQEPGNKDFLRKIIDQPIILGDEFTELHLSERELFKHSLIEILPFSLENGTKSFNESNLWLFYFSPHHDQPLVFTTPLSKMDSALEKSK